MAEMSWKEAAAAEAFLNTLTGGTRRDVRKKMAELAKKHPERVLQYVASLPEGWEVSADEEFGTPTGRLLAYGHEIAQEEISRRENAS